MRNLIFTASASVVTASACFGGPPGSGAVPPDRLFPGGAIAHGGNVFAAGDLNGDGRPDVAGMNWNSPRVFVRLADSDGGYAGATEYLLPAQQTVGGCFIQDVDNDGDQDIVVRSPLIYLHNDGTGAFTVGEVMGVDGPLQAVEVLADVDTDGALDAIVTQSINLGVRWGQGNGSISSDVDWIIVGYPATALGPAFAADLDGDGDLDVAARATPYAGIDFLVLFENEGARQFGSRGSISSGGRIGDVAFGDFDGNGTQDLVMTSSDAPEMRVHHGLGGWTFDPETVETASGISDVLASDIDEDGVDEFIWIAGRTLGTTSIDLLGAYQSRVDGLVPSSSWRLVAADVDASGVPDILGFKEGSEHRVLRADDGRIALQRSFGPPYARAIACGDMNGDGRLDVLTTRYAENPAFLRVFLANAAGGFADPMEFATSVDARCILAIDLDNDGDLDTVCSALASGALPTIHLNSGDGTLNFLTGLSTLGSCWFIAADDMDSDGDLDIVVPAAGHIQVFRNNSGTTPVTFHARPAAAVATNVRVIATGDVNEDGFPDVITNSGTDVSISLSLGNCTFSPRHTTPMGQFSDGLRLVDLNGDAHLDIVSRATDTVAVAFGDGTGAFQSPAVSVLSSDTVAMEIADVDLDGDPDAVVALSVGAIETLLNDGFGGLSSPFRFWMAEKPVALALADADGDGDVDALVTHEYYTGGAFSVIPNLSLMPAAAVDGACCLAPAGCVEGTASECAEVGGAFDGVGSTCASDTCDHTGACCTASYACELSTHSACAEIGGQYLGDGTDCEIGACDPIGACCIADSLCHPLTGAQCGSAGGAYLGDAASCAGAPCDPIGACCTDPDTCVELTASQCASAAGAYLGDHTACAAESCAPPTGACCFACAPAGPTAPCPDYSGAPSFCIDLTAEDCTSAHGQYRGDNSACATAGCICVADVNGDGLTNATDFAMLAAHFGQSPSSCMTRIQGDLNCDGAVTTADFLVLAGDFGCGN